ncbi:MAG TPA: hypothetical protein VI455_08495 [Terriglobia bacterium]
MSLLDARPPKPSRRIGRYVLLAFVAAIIIGGVSYYFWDYPEERAVTRFLETVQRGDYKTAYQLWQPSSSYSYDDFLKDWGPAGDYGKIRQFEVLRASSAASQTVSVTVEINNETPVLKLLVDKRTKGLAYSPF